MKKVWLVLVFALLFAHPAKAQQDIEILEQSATYSFNTSFDFYAKFSSPKEIIDGYVFYQIAGSDHTWVYEGDISDETLTVRVDLEGENTPRAYTDLTYWYRLASDHGEFFETQHYTIFYEDNRFSWQQIQVEPVTLRWYSGDSAFASAILAAATQGVLRAQTMLPLPDLHAVTLQVYDNPQDVQLVAQLAGYEWAAGHTDPAAARVLLALPSGAQQSFEIERQVPHEIAHLMLYQGLGPEDYANLPAWLNEGIASNVEVYSDPLRSEWLRIGNENAALYPFYSLCASFPQDEAAARLAYAQSASFVAYLIKQYNPTGFAALVSAYTKTGDCLNAPLQTFGKDLNQLEQDWRKATFNDQASVLRDLFRLPWPTILTAAALAAALWGIPRLLARRR
jgi:hypothetical protein